MFSLIGYSCCGSFRDRKAVADVLLRRLRTSEHAIFDRLTAVGITAIRFGIRVAVGLFESGPVTGRNQFLVWSNPGVNVMPRLPVLLALPKGSRLNF